MRKPTPVSSSADGPSSGESSSTPELRQTESGNWTPTAQFYLALRYLDKAKARYPPDKSDTYDQFLEIMQAYRKGRDSLSEDSRGYRRGEKRMFEHVFARVQALFKDEEDLIREFTECFVPPSSMSGSESLRAEDRFTERKARL